MKPTHEQKEAFIQDILEVCRKHQMYFSYERVDYDAEYDSDDRFKVELMLYEADLSEIKEML